MPSTTDVIIGDNFRNPTSIQTLGGFAVTVSGTQIRRWKAGRARQLFQFLLANSGRPVPRSTLIDVIWGDSAARCPDVSLKVAVCMLRSVLAEVEDPDDSRSPSLRIVSHPASYALETDDTFVDVDEFEREIALGGARETTGKDDEACLCYRRAIDLYTGPYLPECDESWATIRRERLQDSLLHALDQLAAEAEHRGEQLETFNLHQRMLEIDSCREASYRALMRYHASAQQPSRVEHWYQTCVEQLQTKLGLEPDSQTRQVFYEAMSGQLA
jgi:two-component SAPR family response regulator